MYVSFNFEGVVLYTGTWAVHTMSSASYSVIIIDCMKFDICYLSYSVVLNSQSSSLLKKFFSYFITVRMMAAEGIAKKILSGKPKKYVDNLRLSQFILSWTTSTTKSFVYQI